MSEKLKISERIWAKLNDHNGVLDDDFECIAHDAKALEAEVKELEAELKDRTKIREITEKLRQQWDDYQALQAKVEGESDEL